MQKYIERMITEKKDLDGKILRASKAIENPPFGSDKQGILLLAEQIKHMKAYSAVLAERIEHEGAKNGC